MLSVTIPATEIKIFMSKLLKEEVFDDFEVRGVEVVSLTKFEMSGTLERDAVKDGQRRYFCYWHELKPFVFDIIKGRERPRAMKIIFSVPPDKTEAIHANAASLFLNIIFEGEAVHATTATSQKTFALEKSLDTAWDDYVKVFLRDKGIAYVIE